jgi:hypothetical protein
MKLGFVSFFAALVAAPLAAQAAEPPARFAVTLRATVTDGFAYDVTRSEDECQVHRSGSGSRRLQLRSLRPTRLRISGGPDGAVYRPTRVAARIMGRSGTGSFDETRICRGAPLGRLTGDCKAPLKARAVRPGFSRTGPGALLFRKWSVGDVSLCGLDQTYPGGWLHLAPGRVDEEALLSGRSLRVVASGSATKEDVVTSTPTLKITQKTTVRWTLTFRRLT